MPPALLCAYGWLASKALEATLTPLGGHNSCLSPLPIEVPTAPRTEKFSSTNIFNMDIWNRRLEVMVIVKSNARLLQYFPAIVKSMVTCRPLEPGPPWNCKHVSEKMSFTSASPTDSTFQEWEEENADCGKRACNTDSAPLVTGLSEEISSSSCPVVVAPTLVRDKSRFSSMSASFKLNTNNVNLWVLAEHIPGGNCIFDPRGIALHSFKGKRKRVFGNQLTLYIRLKLRPGSKPRSVMVQVFSNGSVSLAGSRSLKECEFVARKIVDRIKRTRCVGKDGVPKYAVWDPDSLSILNLDCGSPIRIDVVKVDFDLKMALRLESVHRILAQRYSVSYEPEIFPGLKISAAKSVTLVIYGTGKAFMNINAANVSGDTAVLIRLVQEVYAEVCGFIWMHLSEVVNLSCFKLKRGQQALAT
jgi:TATA-box binding protein (TBP) (component of TFIID and TFIIIB)